MCVVSMVADHYNEKWQQYQQPILTTPYIGGGPSQLEFNNLKREVEDLKALLARAKEYDKKNNEPDCEVEAKYAFIREIAEAVGVDLEDVLKK